MSRCFPFPPPGYERKPRSDHVDFLIKEKSKEKKHKKKEKREGKESKDKDRSKDKQREKKDKKEKHRDKTNKGKDRGKDNKRISNERNDQGHTDGHNEEKLAEGRKVFHKISSFTEELVRRLADEGATDQMGKQISSEFQVFENMYNSTEEGRDMGNEIVHNIIVPREKKKDMASAMENRDTSDPMPLSTEQRRADGMGRSTDKDAKRHVEAKEKAKEWKVEDKKGDKHKDKDGEKKHKRKDRDREKEKAKEEKMRRKEEHKHKEQDKSIGIEQRGHVGLQNIGRKVNPQENEHSVGGERSLKRKEINGFLHEKARPDKLSRPSSSSQLPIENGGKLDPSHIVIPCAFDRHEATDIVAERVPASKEHKINGITDVQPPSKSGPLPVAGATGSGKTSKKPPHPDEKYLSQLLCLPKMEEYPEFDDQEWLLSREDARQKPIAEPEADEMPQVWDKALHIDPANILALPYVLPY